jgi:hypothetical protein
MHDNMSGTAIIIILLVITGLIIYQMFYSNEKNCPACNCAIQSGVTSDSTSNCKCQTQQDPIVVNIQQDDRSQSITSIAREYDYRTFNDPLVPPYKRSDYDQSFPPGLVGGYPPIATRGYPTAFKKMGLLNDQSAPNDDKYKFMVIMGRQTYPSSNYYDYYVTENSDESSLKFDLKDLHKELNDGDNVTITELGKTYTIKLDRDVGFRYSPFVF